MLKTSLPSDFNILIRGMKQTDTLSYLDDVITSHYEMELKEELFPAVRKALRNDENVSVVVEMMEKINDFHNRYLNYFSSWPESVSLGKKIQQNLIAHMEWCLMDDVRKGMTKLLHFILKYYLDMAHECCADESFRITCIDSNSSYNDANTIFINGKCKSLFRVVMRKLNLDKMLDDELIISVLMRPVYEELKLHCSEIYDKSFVSEKEDCFLNQLRDNQLFSFLKLVFGDDFDRSRWMKPLDYLLYTSYTQLRIEEFLSIIFAYPDSQKSINDLKYCLDYTGLRPMLIKSLKSDFLKRVSHPGTKSQNIIQAYISAVKALRELDPSGVVMEIVLEPCSCYLRQREDAVRQIMQDLLSPSDTERGDLAAELTNLSGYRSDNICLSERVGASPDEWHPDSRESDPNKASNAFSPRNSDIVSLFIGMYGSKEKFIKEYQKLLSRRLQQNWFKEQDESNEIRNLELFKLRFGEEEVSKCTVMFKDFSDSRRINENFKEKLTQGLPLPQYEVNFRTFIISHNFWPEMTEVEIDLPKEIQESFDKFKLDYERQKASRSLKLVKGVGSVDLDLEFEDESRSYKVNPVLASIVLKFEEKDKWSIEDLSAAIKLPPTVLRKKLMYWIQQGVIKQVRGEDDMFMVVDKIGPANEENMSTMEGEEEADDVDEEKQEEELNMMWNYVKGMLSNLGSLNADRILGMFSMFSDEDSEIDKKQLCEFLNKKVQEGLLTLEQGKYKLT